MKTPLPVTSTVDHENATHSDIMPASTGDDTEEESLFSSVSVLVFIFVLACIAVGFVLFFAYRLRQKAKMVALQSNQFDKNLYMDRRQMDRDNGDLILFEKGSLGSLKAKH